MIDSAQWAALTRCLFEEIRRLRIASAVARLVCLVPLTWLLTSSLVPEPATIWLAPAYPKEMADGWLLVFHWQDQMIELYAKEELDAEITAAILRASMLERGFR